MVLFGGVCVVLFGGHEWFYLGGVHGFIQGVCGFIWGGVRGFIRGGMHGFSSFFGYNEIRSMSGRYASYWNAFLLLKVSNNASANWPSISRRNYPSKLVIPRQPFVALGNSSLTLDNL